MQRAKASTIRARQPSNSATAPASTTKRLASARLNFIRKPPSKASDVYSQAAEKVGEVAQTARDTAARQTSTVAAAIDAGKKAYQEEKRKTELSGRIEAAPKYTEKAN